MEGTYDLVFNSGASETRYTEGDNVSLIEITGSDQEYYQTGVVTLFDVATTQVVGDEVIIQIDSSDEFYGYVARRQQQIRGGKLHTTYQLVGKTYDLWRYHTGANSLHSGYTAQIAYNLISSNCPGISGNDITLTDGTELTNEIDLSNTKIGDALVTLIGYDGYKFYVDNDDELQYYEPETRLYDFTIEETDILDMSPIEEADEDIVNDVIVIGGTDYSSKDEVSTTYPSSTVFPSGIWVAQRITASDHTLKAVKLYLNRSTGDDAPSALKFEIWENTASVLFIDDFDNDKYIDTHYSTQTLDGNLMLDGDTTRVSIDMSKLENASVGAVRDRAGCEFTVNKNCSFHHIDLQGAHTSLYWNTVGYLYLEILLGDPDTGTVIGRTIHKYMPGGGGGIGNNWECTGNIALNTGKTYSFRTVREDGLQENACELRMTHEGITSPGQPWSYRDGGWTAWTTAYDFCFFKVYGIAYPPTGIATSITNTPATQYMKVSLTDVVSSNNFNVSGTNDASTWMALPDGQWVDFGSESSLGTQIKYYLNNDNSPTWTPYASKAKLEISDDTGGIEDVVFDDSFGDETYISGGSDSGDTMAVNNTYWGPNKMSLSSTALYGLPDNYVDSYPGNKAGEGGKQPVWNTPEKIITETGETGTASLIVYQDDDTPYITVGFNGNRYVFGVQFKVWGEWRCDVYLKDVFVSGPAYTGWAKAVSNAGLWLRSYTLHTHKFPSVWSGVRKIKCVLDYQDPDFFQGGDWRAGYMKIGTITDDDISEGSVKSISTELASNVDLTHMIVEPTDVTNAANITYSGSLDNGVNWTKLTPDINTAVGTAGKQAILWYCMKSTSTGDWSSKYLSEMSPASPTIGSCKLTASYTLGGGQPKSGSKIEWSDDWTVSDNDVPYNPDWTEWQSYSDPKLSGLTEDSQYWMVMYHNSANSAYWKYYYDPKDTYDGKIAYSWYGDNFKSKWSSNSQLPSIVPEGNMSFKLGWTEGEITTTAENSDSIDAYGRYFKIINDSTINSLEAAQVRADREVAGMEIIPKKGTITINGRTDMKTYYRFSSNLTNFDIKDIWDVVSYTQRIDGQGFTTTINYGKQPFDLMKVIANLE